MKTVHPKNRFKTGDSIVQYRYNDIIRKGTVVSGPFNVDDVDHYNVEWNWECSSTYGNLPIFREYQFVDFICDMLSRKYHYDLG